MKVQEIATAIELSKVGDNTTRNTSLDYELRTNVMAGDSSTVDILEVFDPRNGEIVEAYWSTVYDPAQRTQMIYG